MKYEICPIQPPSLALEKGRYAEYLLEYKQYIEAVQGRKAEVKALLVARDGKKAASVKAARKDKGKGPEKAAKKPKTLSPTKKAAKALNRKVRRLKKQVELKRLRDDAEKLKERLRPRNVGQPRETAKPTPSALAKQKALVVSKLNRGGTKPKQQFPQSSRKARRAHLQPGAPEPFVKASGPVKDLASESVVVPQTEQTAGSSRAPQPEKVAAVNPRVPPNPTNLRKLMYVEEAERGALRDSWWYDDSFSTVEGRPIVGDVISGRKVTSVMDFDYGKKGAVQFERILSAPTEGKNVSVSRAIEGGVDVRRFGQTFTGPVPGTSTGFPSGSTTPRPANVPTLRDDQGRLRQPADPRQLKGDDWCLAHKAVRYGRGNLYCKKSGLGGACSFVKKI